MNRFPPIRTGRMTGVMLVVIDKRNFQTAVDLWFENQADAISTYGHISDWNTSAVTQMANAFSDRTNFNEDISGWDVSNGGWVACFGEPRVLIRIWADGIPRPPMKCNRCFMKLNLLTISLVIGTPLQ